jgi:hypothetical protein
MPILKPKKGKKRQEFISDCMSDESMMEEFPRQKQRAAICLSQMRRQEASAADLDWVDIQDEIFIIY